jgi:DNA invertase Pin-like site-specific DNA recombinase
MISDHAAEKISADHLRRDAYLYVRQSTLRQVMENTTSTDRQYGLRQRAVALGWAIEQVVVIDEDLGRSGASAEGRDGFQRLVADVGMGKAGIVIGLEVSRLARNNADWHRLLEICALTETLILDEDGLYDSCAFNDRLLLGMKGQMSEAELHLLKARLRGGQLTKARSGELWLPLPVGFVYNTAGRVVLDPDQSVRDAVAHLFATFERAGSARAAVKAFTAEGLKFPSRVQTGPNKGTCNPARRGPCSSLTPTTATSAGTDTKTTFAAWPSAPNRGARTAESAHPEKAPPCSKAWPCAAAAANA